MAKLVNKKNGNGKAKVAKSQPKMASKGKAKLVAKKPQVKTAAKKVGAKAGLAKPAMAAKSLKASSVSKPVSPKTVPPAKGKVVPTKALPVAAKGAKTPAPAAAVEVAAKAGKNAKVDKKAEALAQILLAQQKEQVEVILTNADGKEYCRVHDCDNEATTDGHCRFHYLALWKRNKVKAKILQGGKLDKYIEDLTSKYPDKYLEMLRKDLASEKDFNVIVAEMDVEDSGDEAEQEEDANRFIEEVRGGMPTTDDDEGGF